MQVAKSLSLVELDLVFYRTQRIIAQRELVNEINAVVNAITLPFLERVVPLSDLVFYILKFLCSLTFRIWARFINLLLTLLQHSCS